MRAQCSDFFRQAIDRQPDYALVYAGLADAYLLFASNRLLNPICFNQPAIWFQLAKMRLTITLSNRRDHLRRREGPTANRNRIAAPRVLG